MRHRIGSNQMNNSQHDVEQRTNLARNNRFELLLFRLGEAPNSTQRELYGINVFKVREIIEMLAFTVMAGASDNILGIAGIRVVSR